MKLPNRLASHDLSSTGIEDSDDPRPGYAVPWFDRLLARWEVSQFAAVPFSISVFATPFTVTGFFLSLSGDRHALILALILVSFWALPIVFDQARGWWLFRHPHASPHWLRSVRSAVGTSVFDEALDHLTAVHGHDPDYRIERAHLAEAVRVARYARRKHRQRSGGVRLDAAARHA